MNTDEFATQYTTLLRAYTDVRRERDLLRAVGEATESLVGPENIGKTVNTNIYWEGAISAIMQGPALSKVMVSLAAWRAGSKA